jgi:hypothetical protein
MKSKHTQSIFCGSASAPSDVSVIAQVMVLGLCILTDALIVKYVATSAPEGLAFVVLAGAAGAVMTGALKKVIER